MIRTLVLYVLLSITLFSQNIPYVILISFDGFRWDYLDRGLSPAFDSLAKSGVRASSLQSVFPSKTFPNHYSIVTGLTTENHGLLANSFEIPFNGKYFAIRDTVEVRNGSWYWGEPIWETLKKNRITAASFFWPGSDMHDETRRPAYFKKYEHTFPYNLRVDGVIEWLSLPREIRPRFVTMYFDKIDSDSHIFGPDAPETNMAIQSVDSTLTYLLTRLKTLDIRDSINIVIVSDHGMTEISPERIFNVEEKLRGIPCVYYDSGPFMYIATESPDSVVRLLNSQSYPLRAYQTKNTPGYFKIGKHPYLKEVLIIAEMGWSLVSEKSKNQSWLKKNRGNHGYDNYHMDMHGIFIASGPLFRKNYRTGTLRNIDIYPLLTYIYGVTGSPLIDGSFDNIGFILDEGATVK